MPDKYGVRGTRELAISDDTRVDLAQRDEKAGRFKDISLDPPKKKPLTRPLTKGRR